MSLNDVQTRAGGTGSSPRSAADLISYEDLYTRWEQGNWSAMGLDFTEDARQWREEFTDFERKAALWNYALFFWGEDAVAEPADLVHEALEEDRVTRLVDLLRREEVLLLLARGGVDERGQVVGDGVLAVEEHRVVPQRGAPLVLGHHLVPLAPVLGEVDLHRAPVAALPAGVEIGVRNLRAGGHRPDATPA